MSIRQSNIHSFVNELINSLINSEMNVSKAKRLKLNILYPWYSLNYT